MSSEFSTDFETAPPASRPPFRLQLLGDLALYDSTGARVGEARRKPLAVLAYLAAEAPRPVNRELLAALLWPDVAPFRARRNLAQTLYALRRELGADAVLGVTQLSLDAYVLSSDLSDFRDAVMRGDHALAHANYTGPFLDGVRVAGAAEFEQWSERWRERVEVMQRSLPAAPALTPPPVRVDGTIAASKAAYPLPATLGRRGHMPAFATRAVVLTVLLLGGSATVYSVANRNSTTVSQRSLARPTGRPTYSQRLKAARRPTIDSSRIGRILLLPSLQIDGDTMTNGVAYRVDTLVRMAISESFASTVPVNDVARVERQVEQEYAGWPTTTTLQLARMMQVTGAELAVRPVVSRRGDTTRVSMVYHRSIAHTPRAKSGYSNVESLSKGAILVPPTWRDRSYVDVRLSTARFVRTLESCDINSHYDLDDSPWCWGPGRRLIEPDASANKIRWEVAREMLDRHDEWRARVTAPTTPAAPQRGRRASDPQ